MKHITKGKKLSSKENGERKISQQVSSTLLQMIYRHYVNITSQSIKGKEGKNYPQCDE